MPYFTEVQPCWFASVEMQLVEMLWLAQSSVSRLVKTRKIIFMEYMDSNKAISTYHIWHECSVIILIMNQDSTNLFVLKASRMVLHCFTFSPLESAFANSMFFACQSICCSHFPRPGNIGTKLYTLAMCETLRISTLVQSVPKSGGIETSLICHLRLLPNPSLPLPGYPAAHHLQ